MGFSRRGLIAITPASLAAAVLVSGASLGPGAAFGGPITDLALTCDAAVAPAVIALSKEYRARTGVRVRVFSTAPGLVLPQLEREIQNDIIVTRTITIDQAEKAGLVQPNGRSGPWRNRLVTAAAKQPAGPENSFAVPDPSPACDIDGGAILQRLGVSPGKILGVIDTAAVAWLLTEGGARQGLLHQTEIAADDRLHIVSQVPDDVWPPMLYAATGTKLARRGDPNAFVAFMDSAEGQSALRSAGLESAA